MIPLFIIYMIRQYRLIGNRKKFFLWICFNIRSNTNRVFATVVFLFLVSVTLRAQNRQASYSIIRNGNVAGQLKFQQVIKGDSVCLKTESEVKASFLFSFTVFAREEAIYKNGILLYSSIYRKTNGSEKANKQTRLRGYEYYITSKEKTEVLRNYPISNNMLNLYCCEPKLINKVYSDNFQQYVPVEKISACKYKVTLPDGNYNYYYYKDGECVVVDVHGSMYTAMLVLNK